MSRKAKELDPSAVPPLLEEGGTWLWRQVWESRPDMAAGERAMLEEMCRMKDRLDRLHRVVGGEDFAEYMHEETDEPRYVVVVNGAIAEARLTATAMRGLAISLGLDATRAVRGMPPPTGGGDGPEAEGEDPIDRIAGARGKPAPRSTRA